MKGKFYVYLLWPFKKRLIFWLVTHFNARKFMVHIMEELFQSNRKCYEPKTSQSVLPQETTDQTTTRTYLPAING